MKNLRNKAIMSALALSVGAAASASAMDNSLKDPLFSLKELSTQNVLLAHGEGKCGEGKCGEGKCGEGKCGEKKAAVKAKEGKCGINKIKKVFTKKTKAKSAEAKCGEGKCGGSEKKN